MQQRLDNSLSQTPLLGAIHPAPWRGQRGMPLQGELFFYRHPPTLHREEYGAADTNHPTADGRVLMMAILNARVSGFSTQGHMVPVVTKAQAKGSTAWRPLPGADDTGYGVDLAGLRPVVLNKDVAQEYPIDPNVEFDPAQCWMPIMSDAEEDRHSFGEKLAGLIQTMTQALSQPTCVAKPTAGVCVITQDKYLLPDPNEYGQDNKTRVFLPLGFMRRNGRGVLMGVFGEKTSSLRGIRGIMAFDQMDGLIGQFDVQNMIACAATRMEQKGSNGRPHEWLKHQYHKQPIADLKAAWLDYVDASGAIIDRIVANNERLKGALERA